MKRFLILSVVMMLLASGAGAQNLHNGYAYIDLGLSVQWATCNVGADSPEQYGDYYAWGETTTKSTYYASNCTTWKQDVGDISGALQYDAAKANWGGGWRMPTLAEFNELQDNCTWEWATLGGANGYKVISNINGNSIFLPAAGYCAEESLESDGVRGMYWASTPAAEGTQYAYNFYFDSGYRCAYWISRADGHSLRPVLNVNSDDESNGVEENGNDNSSDNLTDRGPVTKKPANEEPANEKSMNEKSAADESATDELQKSITAGTYNGHAYVDLGLRVKWATCNVGADSPEQYGDYYAWGETATKSIYTEDTYVADNKNHEDIKGTSLDVAHVKWGGNWRMPTKAEFDELVDNCTWVWTSQNGKSGYKIIGPNGNSIFLPAAGYRYGDSLEGAESYGHYWSSMSYAEDYKIAYYLYFKVDNRCTNWEGCSLGHSIRPVLE